ncbi:MAG: polyprenyl diphosphate synthase [Patescibacteria group bacterium]|nr:polyprenyl diphosphate synthase [Patescibacteria group bacterium]
MANPFPPGTKLPNHLAIIPDGNRRWAKIHHLPSFVGHQKGFQVLLQMAKQARKWGIHTVTFWGFSTENWQRSKEEVKYLMELEEATIKKYLPEFQKDKVRIIHLGRKDRIPLSFQKTLEKAEKETVLNQKHVLNIAVDYGGRDELLRAITRIKNLKFKIKNLNEEKFSEFLDTRDQPYPNPDLLVRTSGEMRTSGLLPWQMAYTEFVFIKKYLPDCSIEDLKQAILEYSHRQRRFGGN